jgi:lipid-A-disaccharide synthase
MPIFAKTIGILAMQYPNLAIAVMVPANVMRYVAPFFDNCPFRAIVTSDETEKKDAIAASNLAIVKSGTIAIEVAMAQVPMVVTYRVHSISAWLMKRMALIKYVNLINILQKKGIIPELLQELCTPFMLANACLNLLSSPERQNNQKINEKSALTKLLLPGGESPSAKAASTILKLLTH